MNPITPTVDATDPAVALIAWGLTILLAKYAPWLSDRGRPVIPVAAVLVAVGVRAGIDASMGDPLTLATVVRGIGAGTAAVMGHSQLREAQKAMVRIPAPSAPVPPAATETAEADAAETETSP